MDREPESTTLFRRASFLRTCFFWHWPSLVNIFVNVRFYCCTLSFHSEQQATIKYPLYRSVTKRFSRAANVALVSHLNREHRASELKHLNVQRFIR